jgi:sialic acid synthase SpsE
MSEHEVYIIAEIGINHNGSLDNCFKRIDAAASAGCNAAKFQFFKAATLYPKSAGRLRWKDKKGAYSYNIYDATEKFSMPENWIEKLIYYCKRRNIDFLSSVFDIKEVNFLIKMGLTKIKLSSYTVTNLPLIEHCARKGLQIIMSTGGASLSEIEDAASEVMRHHKMLSLLHCSLAYPTKLSECNLGVMETMRLTFCGIPIGFSDHTAEVFDAAVQAVYLGAKVIEKHITLDKKMPGPDQFFALEPSELKLMVKKIRQAERVVKKGRPNINKLIYGLTSKAPTAREMYLRDFSYMFLFARRSLKRGEIIRVSDIMILRPGNKKHGLEPKFLGFFKKYKITAKKDINFEEPITWGCILQ